MGGSPCFTPSSHTIAEWAGGDPVVEEPEELSRNNLVMPLEGRLEAKLIGCYNLLQVADEPPW